MKKRDIIQAAGRYISSHEEMKRINTHNHLNDFMHAHGAKLAAALAPELMNHLAVQRYATALTRLSS